MTDDWYTCRRCGTSVFLTGAEIEEIVVIEGELICGTNDCKDTRTIT